MTSFVLTKGPPRLPRRRQQWSSSLRTAAETSLSPARPVPLLSFRRGRRHPVRPFEWDALVVTRRTDGTRLGRWYVAHATYSRQPTMEGNRQHAPLWMLVRASGPSAGCTELARYGRVVAGRTGDERRISRGGYELGHSDRD